MPQWTLLQRIASKVTISETGCWIWTGYHNRLGYGRVQVDGKVVNAHRALYRLCIGPIPEGLEIDHLCRVRDCVNPLHLEPVSHAENCARAAAALVTFRCGHPTTSENVIRDSVSGARRCRICRREQTRSAQQRHRARLT